MSPLGVTGHRTNLTSGEQRVLNRKDMAETKPNRVRCDEIVEARDAGITPGNFVKGAFY